MWTRIAVAVACLLLVPVGAAVAAEPAARPLNFLLAGIDPRGTHTRPFADTIIVAHIPADRRDVYLFSIPRDLVVWIPAFAENGTPGRRTKINAAMAYGSQAGNGEYRPAQGFRLLSRAVGDLTGIKRFDGGAIINFGGLQKLVDALGGVKMVIDQDVVSEHKKPDGTPRDRLPECLSNQGCLRPYTGVQKQYQKSDFPVRLKGWEALDYLRQRYGLPRSDYDRTRHQRQFLRAVAKKLSRDPARLLKVVGAVGDSLTVVDGERSVLSTVGALTGLDAGDVTTIDLPGAALFEDGRYLGEQYPTAQARDFFAAVVADRVRNHLRDHPGLLDR